MMIGDHRYGRLWTNFPKVGGGLNGDFDEVYPLDESATHPIELLATRLGVLFLLAGSSLRRRLAYPDAPPAAHSGAFN